jgi:hypothetical protein
MTPISKTDIVLGPPNPPELINQLVRYDDISPEDVSEYIVLFINEDNISKSPQVDITISNGIQISAILDSGSEVNLLSGSNYEKLIKAGIEAPELPLENMVLVTAFGKRSQRIRRQALIEFTIGNDLFEGVFMITPRLTNEAIIGCNLLKEYGFNINFATESFSYTREGELREHLFSQRPGLQKVQSDDRSLAEDPFRKQPTPRVQRPFPKPADGQPEIPIPQQADSR